MSAAERVAEVVGGTVAALALLDADALEALEARLQGLVGGEGADVQLGPEPLGSNKELVTRLELLGRCVAMTAENLQVLERLSALWAEPAGLTQLKQRS